jgi:hypothetical protein
MSGVVGKSGFVYFIATESGSAVKVGAARDPKKRLSSLQTGNHERLHLLRTIHFDDPEGAEADYHRSLAAARIRGEWFESEAILDFLGRDDFPFLERRLGNVCGLGPAILREVLEESEAKRSGLESALSRARGHIWRCAREIRLLTADAQRGWTTRLSDERLAALEAKWGSDW